LKYRHTNVQLKITSNSLPVIFLIPVNFHKTVGQN